MKPLDKIIKKNGYTYIQIYRGDKSVIYAQRDHNKTIAYEVFLIRIKPKRKIGDIILEANEWYPPDEAFGVWAWTCKTIDRAMTKFKSLENE